MGTRSAMVVTMSYLQVISTQVVKRSILSRILREARRMWSPSPEWSDKRVTAVSTEIWTKGDPRSMADHAKHMGVRGWEFPSRRSLSETLCGAWFPLVAWYLILWPLFMFNYVAKRTRGVSGALLTHRYPILNLLFFVSISLTVVCHWEAMHMDPGRIEVLLQRSKLRNAPPNLPDPFCLHRCGKCEVSIANRKVKECASWQRGSVVRRRAWKPARAYHCRCCGDCVFQMDHHCPWINNCVGYFNRRYFILFLQWLALSSAIALVLLMDWLNICYRLGMLGKHFKSWRWTYSYLQTVCSIIFGIIMSIGQLVMNVKYLSTDASAVEELKSINGSALSRLVHPIKPDFVHMNGGLPLRRYVDSVINDHWKQDIISYAPGRKGPFVKWQRYEAVMGTNCLYKLLPIPQRIFYNLLELPSQWPGQSDGKCWLAGCTHVKTEKIFRVSSPLLHRIANPRFEAYETPNWAPLVESRHRGCVLAEQEASWPDPSDDW